MKRRSEEKQMKIIIDIPEKDYELTKNGHIPFRILEVFKNCKPVKETIIFDDDGVGHKVYKECEE